MMAIALASALCSCTIRSSAVLSVQLPDKGGLHDLLHPHQGSGEYSTDSDRQSGWVSRKLGRVCPPGPREGTEDGMTEAQ